MDQTSLVCPVVPCQPLKAGICSAVDTSWVSSSATGIVHSLTLRWRPTQILGARQTAMTVVEQLSGFLLSSDRGRSSILLYYYTTFPCVCQLFLSYRELYSFQTSAMNLQKRSKFYLFFLSILKQLPEGINVFIYSLVCSDVNTFLCSHLMVAYPSHLVMKLLWTYQQDMIPHI